MPHETAAVSVQVLCTPYNDAPCHFMQSHIHKMYACLAVTCHLHLWQNDRDLLHATAVTRRWNGYRTKSQHRKSTLEKKILPLLQLGFKPMTFQSGVRRSNQWAIPAPHAMWWLTECTIYNIKCITPTPHIMLCGSSQNWQIWTHNIRCITPTPTQYYVVAHRMDRFGHTILDVLPQPQLSTMWWLTEWTDLDTQY